MKDNLEPRTAVIERIIDSRRLPWVAEKRNLSQLHTQIIL